jgi:hypothetical protein
LQYGHETVNQPPEPLIVRSSTSDIEKLTVIPLVDFNPFNSEKLPPGGFDLGFGVTVEDFSEHMAKLSLGVWKGAFSHDQMEDLQEWSTCLVRRYRAAPTIGPAENDSSNFLGYVIAHLRLIIPNRTSRTDELHLQVTDSEELDAFSCSKSSFWPQIHLTDCEKAISGIKLEHLSKLKLWMPWISEFSKNWRKYYPLWVSLSFFEKFYTEFESFRARHLFRVMALEALLCSEQDKDYGRQALRSKIPKLLGWHYDLYSPYHHDLITFCPPELPLTDKLVDDMYTLRNKVAHGDQMPLDWDKTYRSGFVDGELPYSYVLCEAAGSILRLTWLKIISESLQKSFADKKRMQRFFHE